MSLRHGVVDTRREKAGPFCDLSRLTRFAQPLEETGLVELAPLCTKLDVATLDGCHQIHAALPALCLAVGVLLQGFPTGHFETVNLRVAVCLEALRFGDVDSPSKWWTRRSATAGCLVWIIGNVSAQLVSVGGQPRGQVDVALVHDSRGAETLPKSSIVCLSKCGIQFRSEESEVQMSVRSC